MNKKETKMIELAIIYIEDGAETTAIRVLKNLIGQEEK